MLSYDIFNPCGVNESIMSKEQEFRKQRDRFLAFAFASADLFVEVSEEGKVVLALGATKGMTGVENPEELHGKKWLELFSTFDQAELLRLYENAKPGARVGPMLIELNELITKRKAVFTGIKMPGNNKFYITLGLSNLVMSKIAAMQPKVQGPLYDRETFLDTAIDTLDFARSVGQDVDLTVFDFAPTEDDKHRIGEENWGSLVESIGQFLQSQSIDGMAAAEVGNGRYSVIHDKDIDGKFLRDRIEKLAVDNDPTGEGVDIKTKTITSDLSELSERDAAKALVYTINEFSRKGAELTIESLNSGLEAYTSANVDKMKEFQSLIDRLDFKLHYQPIVNLKTEEVSHYEMLSRFSSGDTMEWVMFGEDMGMASKFDAAVCELAINTITRKFAGSRSKFSINLSGQSIEDEHFFEKLMKMLNLHKKLNERIMFEITESTHIKDLGKADEFIKALQEEGYKVALDDFGAGAASFNYLQKLSIDTVKIDGKYIRKLLTSKRDAAMVKNLVQMCKDLEIGVIAEYVQERTQADMLHEMGVELGQGYLFGMPKKSPEYKTKENA